MLPDDQAAPVELLFSGRKLKGQDYLSKADPFIRVFLQTAVNGQLNQVGQTQTVNNNPDPDWKTRIPIEYFFEVKQPMRVEVHDEDTPTSSKLIGQIETYLDCIMGAPKQHKILEIKDLKGNVTGTIVIRAEKIECAKFNLKMKWKGGKIANMDSYFSFWDKSDPYLRFYKIRSDGTTIEAARTEPQMNNQEPSWKPIIIPSTRLISKMSPDSMFKVECWDFDEKEENHKKIGQFDIKLSVLDEFSKSGAKTKDFTLVNKDVTNPGTIILEKYEVLNAPYSFIDYIRSGLQLSLAVGIDFTASNVPTSEEHKGKTAIDNPLSLHYISGEPNQYQRVLRAVWDIIQNYDSDSLIPALGFGGKPHFEGLNQNVVSHCFPLTGSVNKVEITGLEKLMESYVWALKHVQLSGPTHFQPIIQKAFKVAEHFKNKYEYQVLLILTDGFIHDMEQTKDFLVANAHLPMSIIIVGIGEENFDTMFELCGDIENSKKQKIARDLVQFVPFKKFGGNAVVLTKELLRKIPEQVVQYMTLQKKEPQEFVLGNIETIPPK